MKKRDLLLTNGTGYSIKNWFLYGVTLAGVILLFIAGFVLIVDVWVDGQVNTNIGELSQFVGAVSALFVAAGLPKIAGEIMEKRKKNDTSGTN